MNPFKSRWPIEDRNEWIGSQKIFTDLESCLDQKVNVVIMGPQGSGKTALLNCFFTFAYKKKMALERKILIYSADLSTRADGRDICAYLADQLIHSVKRLLRESAQIDEIIKAMDDIESKNEETRLRQLIEFLHDECGYFIVLVMDNFELFTSSPNITMDHHEILRSLIEARMLQCIVATNYDLTQDSLPLGVRGSYLLHKFTYQILLPAFTDDEAIAFIQKKQEGCNVKIDAAVIRALFRLSGGIPWLLEAAAECAYDSMEQNEGKMNAKETKEALYSACLPLMRSWCKLLTESQLTVLRILAEQIQNNKEFANHHFTGNMELLSAVASLKARGLVRQVYYVTENGNISKSADNHVTFNSLLFQRFCNEGKMMEAARKNPLVPNEEGVAKYGKDSMTDMGAQELHIHVHDDAKVFLPGSQDCSQTLNAKNVQINRGITPAQLLSVLNDPRDIRQLFSEYLSRRESLAIPMQEESLENQIIQDIEVDEDQELVDVTADELQSLDTRFHEVRSRCRPDITDELLETQSERCQFYVKLSVIVEDALSFSMGDFSPQLVLYGKALEQALRDNLYELFHRERNLSVYDTRTHSVNEHSQEIFKNKSINRTYIGNYNFLIAEQKSYLALLCQQYNLFTEQFNGSTAWVDWWRQLQSDIDSARMIRNLTDHADDSSPDKANLDMMCSLLFGDEGADGILRKTLIGRTLSAQILPVSIPRDVANQMIGQPCEMKCIALKPNGGMSGLTCTGGYSVKLSPRKVLRYRNAIQQDSFQPVGQIFRVIILEYKVQDEQEFFSAKFEM